MSTPIAPQAHALRLTAHAISQLFSSGVLRRTARNIFFDILATPNTLSHGRFAVVVPKSLGIAADRNRVRRRIRELCRTHKLFLTPSDMLIMCKKPAMTASFKELAAQFSNLKS